MPKPTAAVPSAKLELYEKLVATNPNVERKGATVPYTSLNGHMFSYLSKEGKLALRLPAGEREALQNQTVPGVWSCAARIRRGSRLIACIHAGIEEILRSQLRVRGRSQTEAHHKKEKVLTVTGLRPRSIRCACARMDCRRR